MIDILSAEYPPCIRCVRFPYMLCHVRDQYKGLVILPCMESEQFTSPAYVFPVLLHRLLTDNRVWLSRCEYDIPEFIYWLERYVHEMSFHAVDFAERYYEFSPSDLLGTAIEADDTRLLKTAAARTTSYMRTPPYLAPGLSIDCLRGEVRIDGDSSLGGRLSFWDFAELSEREALLWGNGGSATVVLRETDKTVQEPVSMRKVKRSLI